MVGDVGMSLAVGEVGTGLAVGEASVGEGDLAPCQHLPGDSDPVLAPEGVGAREALVPPSPVQKASTSFGCALGERK